MSSFATLAIQDKLEEIKDFYEVWLCLLYWFVETREFEGAVKT